MKWKIKNKEYKYTRWHKWFAWRPVQVGDSKVWLEIIYRKQVGYTEYHWLDILAGTPEWDYKDNIFDIIKDAKEV